MVFEGTIGNGFHGDIAVDDVSVTKGLCQLPGIVIEMLFWWGGCIVLPLSVCPYVMPLSQS